MDCEKIARAALRGRMELVAERPPSWRRRLAACCSPGGKSHFPDAERAAQVAKPGGVIKRSRGGRSAEGWDDVQMAAWRAGDEQYRQYVTGAFTSGTSKGEKFNGEMPQNIRPAILKRLPNLREGGQREEAARPVLPAVDTGHISVRTKAIHDRRPNYTQVFTAEQLGTSLGAKPMWVDYSLGDLPQYSRREMVHRNLG